jgi:hypothetical protein
MPPKEPLSSRSTGTYTSTQKWSCVDHARTIPRTKPLLDPDEVNGLQGSIASDRNSNVRKRRRRLDILGHLALWCGGGYSHWTPPFWNDDHGPLGAAGLAYAGLSCARARARLALTRIGVAVKQLS